MSPPEECRKEGCDRPRGRHSVFCDEHHREQLVRSGLLPAVPPEPCEAWLQKCLRRVRYAEAGAISSEELSSALFDIFVHAAIDGFAECWGTCIESLPHTKALALLSYAKEHPAPRCFHPLPRSQAEKGRVERRALAVQAALVERLERFLAQTPT